MNKMTKGSIATGVDVALLLGGGGTLAVWNTSVQSGAGRIAAGNLDLSAAKGVWTDAKTEIINDIGSYAVVPGDVFSDLNLVNQHVDVVVEILLPDGSTMTRTIEQPKDQLPGCV